MEQGEGMGRGRPRLREPRVPCSVMLAPRDAEQLREMAMQDSTTVSHVARRLIERALREEQAA